MRDPWLQPPDCNAALVLADGTVFWGSGFGARGAGGRRGLLQHRDDRLPGDPDRSVLCRSDHQLHLSAYRQCRDERARISKRPPRRRAVCRPQQGHRAGQLARHQVARCLARSARAHRDFGRRYAAADPADPRSRTAQRGRSPTIRNGRSTLRRCMPRASAWPGLEGMDLASEVTCRQTYEWDETGVGARARLRPAAQSASSCRRHRLRRQAQHPANARPARLPGHRGSGHRLGRGHPAPLGPMGSFCRTGRATRRRPANMRCRCCAT